MADASDRIRVEWFLDEAGSKGELRELAQRLREADPEAQVDVVEPLGILPVLGWVAAAIGLVHFAREITELVCRIREDGVIIDARQDPVKVREDPTLPGGTVIVIAKDGESKQHNVCEQPTDLAALMKAAGAGT